MQSTFYYLLLAIFLLGQPVVARNSHIDGKSRLSNSSAVRPESKNWNPHALVASMLDRLSPKPPTWDEPAFDSFEMNLNSLRLRLKNLASDFNEAELAALDTEAARIENAQKLILKRFEAIQEETKLSATEEQKENLEKIIQIFQLRLEEARKVKELTSQRSKTR